MGSSAAAVEAAEERRATHRAASTSAPDDRGAGWLSPDAEAGLRRLDGLVDDWGLVRRSASVFTPCRHCYSVIGTCSGARVRSCLNQLLASVQHCHATGEVCMWHVQ